MLVLLAGNVIFFSLLFRAILSLDRLCRPHFFCPPSKKRNEVNATITVVNHHYQLQGLNKIVQDYSGLKQTEARADHSSTSPLQEDIPVFLLAYSRTVAT